MNKIQKLSGARKAFSAALFLLTCLAGIVSAQDDFTPSDTTRRNAIRLFIDCQSCDMNYIREEMPYINYVRDVREAQLYLLVTRQSAGSGGNEFTLFFSGQEQFAGMKDTLTYSSSPDNTQDLTRRGLTNTMAIGLMRYVAKTPIKNNVVISYQGERQEEPEQVADKWDYWVFELQTSPDFSLEKSQEQYSWRNSVSIDRVTPELKFQNSFGQNYDKNIYIRDMYDQESGEMEEMRIEAVRRSWNFSNLTAKSLTDHWSVGAKAEVSSSSFSNLDLQVRVSPAIEYDIFPYSQSNQKQLRVLYGLGYVYNDYIDTTVYDKMYERLFEQTLDIALQFQQRWGSANISLGASSYLNDFEKNRVELDGFIRVRLLKGLSLNINGSVAFIHNQIELAKGDRSDEDVYLRLKELETNYRYEGGIGITYTFGSIYNNIVNPRFGNGGGFSGGMGGYGGGGYGGGYDDD